jgi:hypothetical protein
VSLPIARANVTRAAIAFTAGTGGGQFSLCYRHHPDYQGKKPTVELIQRLHHEHLERQAAIHGKLNDVYQHLMVKPAAANRGAGPAAPAAPAASSGNAQAGPRTPDGPSIQRGT